MRAFLAFLAFGISIINARYLGPEGVGILALLLLVKAFAFRFGNLGFGSSFAFFVAKEKADFRQIFKISKYVSLVISIACLLIFLNIWKNPISPWNDIQFSYYLIAVSVLPFTFFNNFTQRILSGRLKITKLNIASILNVLIQLILVIFLVVLFKFGIYGAIISSVFSDIAMTIILIIFAKTESNVNLVEENVIEEIKTTKLLKNLWNYGRWTYLLMFTNLLVEELPLVFLKKITGDNILVGFFSKARSVGRQSRLVVEPFTQMLFPFTAASTEERATRRTNILCRNSLIIMTLVIITLMIFIKPIIVLLYGEEFIPSAKIYIALAPGVIIFPFGHFLEIHVAASGKPRDIFIASVSTLIVSVGICFLLIPRYGSVGAGLSVSLIYMFRALFRLIAYVRMTKSPVKQIIFPSLQDFAFYQALFRTLNYYFLKKAKSV
ncbi:MAG: oligosaccharide flippase family protein [Syntrophotaleaceae bacterium]